MTSEEKINRYVELTKELEHLKSNMTFEELRKAGAFVIADKVIENELVGA